MTGGDALGANGFQVPGGAAAGIDVEGMEISHVFVIKRVSCTLKVGIFIPWDNSFRLTRLSYFVPRNEFLRSAG